MKLKIYFLVIVATVMIASTNAQERLTYWDFPSFGATSFSTWFPVGWSYAGTPFQTGCITANATKKLKFENVAAPGMDFREVFQEVKLGIGTFRITTNAASETWDPVTTFHIVVYDPAGVEICNLPIVHSGTTYTVRGPVEFITTVNGTYRYSIQCGPRVGFANAAYKYVSCFQIDGDEYDPANDPTTSVDGVNKVNSKLCTAVVSGEKIVINSEEEIAAVSLLSINGSLISKAKVGNKSFEILKPTQKGVYIVRINTATQNRAIKIAY